MKPSRYRRSTGSLPTYERVRELGVRGVLAKIAKRLRKRSSDRRELTRAVRYGTRAHDPRPLQTRLQPFPDASIASLDADEVLEVAGLFVDHRFDVLGSGWTRVAHGIVCRGLEGISFGPTEPVRTDGDGTWLRTRIAGANASSSARLWSLVGAGYEPIDWQLDFKSGFRWSEQAWHSDIRYGDIRGADVKVPWELARCQHLPQLAIASVVCRAVGRPELAERFAREVRDEVLDFAAQNPPRFGVNWACTMDVAIRIVNQLIAYDILVANECPVDDGFASAFGAIVLEHGRHIRTHLEWDPILRANHYLADIVGLVFCAAYLAPSEETAEWWSFGVAELESEVLSQFNADGTNFEASTSYHRLSAEMVAFATALVLGSSDGGWSPPYAERLERAARFVTDASKPSGQAVQFGDNDSGRLLKLRPTRSRLTVKEARARYANLEGYAELQDDASYWLEEVSDHRHVVSALDTLFSKAPPSTIDAVLISQLSRGRVLSRGDPAPAAQVAGPQLAVPPAALVKTVEVSGGRATQGLSTVCYPLGGFYFFHSDRVVVAVRCGSVGQKGNGGHAHNDQLGVVVRVDGKAVIDDPGTYLYTPLPERRNGYRSVRAHHAPQVASGEPGRLDLGLFRLGGEGEGECLRFDADGFIGRHRGFGAYVYREVRIHDDRVVISDWADPPLVLTAPPAPPPTSPGYGIRSRERDA